MTHQPTSHEALPRIDASFTRLDRVDRINWEPAHLTGPGGGTPAALRHYIVGCRASALVLEREGRAQEARYLRDTAAAAEAAEAAGRRLPQPQLTRGDRR